tara:strand:+ start:983 stop:1318 length:336 start_codon:yes stop_codon:yes gene_type:complete
MEDNRKEYLRIYTEEGVNEKDVNSMSREELQQAYKDLLNHHDRKIDSKNNQIDDLDKKNEKLNSLRNVLIEHLNLDDYITDIVTDCIYDYNLDDVVRDKVEDVLRDARIEI